jgi:hypothetical protein
MISTANDSFREPVATENIGRISSRSREELQWLANFLTGLPVTLCQVRSRHLIDGSGVVRDCSHLCSRQTRGMIWALPAFGQHRIPRPGQPAARSATCIYDSTTCNQPQLGKVPAMFELASDNILGQFQKWCPDSAENSR